MLRTCKAKGKHWRAACTVRPPPEPRGRNAAARIDEAPLLACHRYAERGRHARDLRADLQRILWARLSDLGVAVGLLQRSIEEGTDEFEQLRGLIRLLQERNTGAEVHLGEGFRAVTGR